MSINFNNNLGIKSNVIGCKIITGTGKKLRCKSIWANYNSVPTKIWEYVSKTNRYLLIPYSNIPYLTSDFMFFNAGNISYIGNGSFSSIKKIMYYNNKYYIITDYGSGNNRRISYFLVEDNDILLGNDNLFDQFDYVDNIEHYENNIFVTGRRRSDNRTCTFYSNNSIDWTGVCHWDVSQGSTDLYLTHMVESNDYLIGFDTRTESIYRINKSNLNNYNWEKMTDKLLNTPYIKISHSNMGKIDNTIYLTLCDNRSGFRNYYSVDDGETWNLFNDTIGFKKICFGNNFAIGTLLNKGYLCKITPTISLDYIDYPATPETLNYADNTFFICSGNRIFCSIDGELWDEYSSPDGLINIIYKL